MKPYISFSAGPAFQAYRFIMWNMKISVSTFCNLFTMLQQSCPTPGLKSGRLDQVISAPENVKMVQHYVWPQKLTLLPRNWNILSVSGHNNFFSRILANSKRKKQIWIWSGLCMSSIETRRIHLNRNWLILKFFGSRN
jgi:hypothetical protein